MGAKLPIFWLRIWISRSTLLKNVLCRHKVATSCFEYNGGRIYLEQEQNVTMAKDL